MTVSIISENVIPGVKVFRLHQYNIHRRQKRHLHKYGQMNQLRNVIAMSRGQGNVAMKLKGKLTIEKNNRIYYRNHIYIENRI